MDCDNLVLGGRSGWRLPNYTELFSLMDLESAASPLINATYFPNAPTGSANYFTSTTNPNVGQEGFSYQVDTLDGGSYFMSKPTAAYVRCVATAN